ncbi:MAG: aldo/keto reductase, partial [Chloroflexi bacterium]|nr:aldo/keto reductase [Chloroflexota bacterium]
MKYKQMGRTGLKVSELCLGTATFGSQVAEADAINLLDAALDAGINLFDTSTSYPPPDGKRSEEIIGKAFKNKRHSAILITKVANRTGPGVNDIGLSRKHIMETVEASLQRLQTDYIDLYCLHLP